MVSVISFFTVATTIMPFAFVNSKMVMSVTNTEDGSAVHLNKAGLNVMKDDAAGFSIKSDCYLGYFRYADVETPATDTLDDLVDILMGWANDIYDNRFWTGPLFIRPKE